MIMIKMHCINKNAAHFYFLMNNENLHGNNCNTNLKDICGGAYVKICDQGY